MIKPGENVYYFHNDHLATPQVLTDDSQAIAWKAVYTPFGAAVPSIQTVENPFRFPGQYYDPETGLHYNYFRYYNPQTGRYITPDPIGLEGGINLFAYVDSVGKPPSEANLYTYTGNNPVNYIDPSGLWGVGIIGQASAGVGLGAGAIGTISGGGGVFWGNGLNLGAFNTGGAFAGIGPYGPRYPDTPGSRDWNSGYVVGYGASGGGGLFGTNAKSVCDLRGPFKTFSIGGGALWGGELTIAWSNGTYFVSLIGTASPLPWLSGMASLINTNTAVKPLAGR